MTLSEEIKQGESRFLDKIHVLEGWGSGFSRIFRECQKYGLPMPEFLEIGDMLRVNFYRPSAQTIGDKSAINSEIGDKSATNSEIGDKSAINSIQKKILSYLSEHRDSRSQDISRYIGLKISRTRDYLSQLVEEGKIISHGANKNRTYSLPENTDSDHE